MGDKLRSSGDPVISLGIIDAPSLYYHSSIRCNPSGLNKFSYYPETLFQLYDFDQLGLRNIMRNYVGEFCRTL